MNEQSCSFFFFSLVNILMVTYYVQWIAIQAGDIMMKETESSAWKPL